MEELLRNPIVLGLLSFIIIYGICYYRLNNKLKNSKKKKDRKKQIKLMDVNILIPGIVGILVWFGTSIYYENNNVSEPTIINKKIVIDKIQKDNLHYVKKGKVEIPKQEVFLDIPNF